MLLTEYPELYTEVDFLKFSFKFNFNTIQNLYYGLNDEIVCRKLNIKSITPLQLLEELGKGFNIGYFSLLIHSSIDGSISLDTIIEVLNDNNLEELKNINFMFNSIMIQSLVYIDKADENKVEEKEKRLNKNENEESEKEIFEDWFNYFYTMSIDKLKLSMNDFLNSTPAQIKERVSRLNTDLKIIHSYIHGLSGGNKKEETEIKEVTDIRDFANLI